jgi:septal ring factor EnvC (AmiA/AmiB activator)
MALTRKALKAMGIEDEKIEQIIEMHSETVSALKDEIDDYKDMQNKLDTVTKERDELKTAADNNKTTDSDKDDEISNLKAQIEQYKAAETLTAKKTAYTELLTAAGVDGKRHNAIIKLTDFNSIELDEQGKIKDSDKLTESVKADYADFIVQTGTQEHKPNTPPDRKDTEVDDFIAGFDAD